MSDFMPVLVVAIILFAILLIIFGGELVTISRPSDLRTDETIDFGSFRVFYTASEVDAVNKSGEISNGVFNKNDERIGFIASESDQVSEGLIDLKVFDSNFYGKLIILINSKEVYSDYPAIGETLIAFDSSVLKENNVMDITSESSGWRIWAPTVYSFNANVRLDYTGRRDEVFTFEVNELEKKYMTNARVVAFGNRTGVGNLNVIVNNVVVASGKTTLYQDFATSILRTGNNTIKFYADPNTTYDISSAQIILLFE